MIVAHLELHNSQGAVLAETDVPIEHDELRDLRWRFYFGSHELAVLVRFDPPVEAIV